MSRLSEWLAPKTVVHAHSDIPCGISTLPAPSRPPGPWAG